MKDGKTLINQRLKNLQTTAGPTNSASKAASSDLTKYYQAINAVFRKLRAASPIKFRSAFPTQDDIEVAKSLWLDMLKEYTPERIVNAADLAIRHTEFFPDLKEILHYCRLRYEELGLKQPLAAYYEACNVTEFSPDYCWSHPAVYLAAKATGWMVLRTEEQRIAYPLFKRNYEQLCQRLLDGESLDAPIALALEHKKASIQEMVERQSNKQLQAAMQAQGINPKGGRAAFLALRSKLKKSSD
ncbi:replication protein P [Zooshikella sp. RANM57]|uniref:replication protein P n=1 Tax=Zooshikella sp. RANM57 TaxID=3425863 RepID=UPI003D6ECB59